MLATQSTLHLNIVAWGRQHYAGNCFSTGWIEKPRFHHHEVNLCGYIKAETKGTKRLKLVYKCIFQMDNDVRILQKWWQNG